jgi:UPF0755 protein
MPRKQRRRPYLPLGCILPLLFVVVAVVASLLIPLFAMRTYGPASENLNGLQRLQYSALLLWYDGLVTRPGEQAGGEQDFMIPPGEGIATLAGRLEQAGLIRDADAFRAYLIYSGLDTSIQAGEYRLNPALTSMQIAQRLQDATPTEVKFVILPGWRMDEIAASLPRSGLNITPDEFLAVARDPRADADFLPPGASAEGFLFPDQYTLPRVVRAEQLVGLLLNHFALALTPEMRDGFTRQGLNVYQAVTLASIVQREAVQDDEQPLIASVFLNRLAAGMRLGGDPTVQYALGFDSNSNSWWKSPLSLDDLKVDSPYNTYIIPGLPPGPIASPSLGALQAVASPAKTGYYFFRARCDGSNRHVFAQTFDEQLQNACP